MPRFKPKIKQLTIPEAYQAYCSMCGALPGEDCIYVLAVNHQRPYSSSPRVLAGRERVGKPTRRPHTTRYYSDVRRLHMWLQEHGHILWETLHE